MNKFRNILVHCLLFIGNYSLFGQVTFKVLVANPSPSLKIYLVGNFNQWNPKDERYLMRLQADGSYAFQLKKVKKGEKIEYKFTQGSWDSEAVDSLGIVPNNYSFLYQKKTTVYHRVANWKNKLGNLPNMANQHTVIGNVQVLQTDFEIPQLNRKRRIWIYLPPDYERSISKSYPVIYMHDGQNLFDNVFSAFGEWGIDEAMQKMFAEGYPTAIIVGIDNGGNNRINEYAAWANPTHGGGEGDKYMQFIVNTLKPYIDKRFRTLSDRENTALMGSSMGGLISMYGGIQYQNIFGKLGIFSPSFWFTPKCYQQITEVKHQFPMKIYFLCGGQESTTMVSDVEKMRNTLLAAGFNANELTVKVVPHGQHSEWLWRQEYAEAYQWLFDAKPVDTAQSLENPFPFLLSPSPIKQNLTITFATETPTFTVSLYNTSGQNVFHQIYHQNTDIPLSQLSIGIYLLIVEYEGVEYRKKILKN